MARASADAPSVATTAAAVVGTATAGDVLNGRGWGSAGLDGALGGGTHEGVALRTILPSKLFQVDYFFSRCPSTVRSISSDIFHSQ